MDGGSGLNILYAETLKGMGIPMSKLSESNMSFHGVISGKKAESLGQITLDMLKMPGPRGVITVTGNRQKAEECLQKGSKIADEQMAAVEMEEYKKNADPSDLLRAKNPSSDTAYKSTGETKAVHVHPTDPNAAPTHISTTLDSK
ncbi:uncharacterized protein [Aegilops tauschii subsp. strangulata]|uniref:uncharacterized protein n=1 Tax=Aegilops tauschii subsp. strangulata TaxID=200361 RepID=UPI001ABBEFF0|nr:uncharacterized protein LOC109762651 [Aegilops tauschii subsp. strangulata]